MNKEKFIEAVAQLRKYWQSDHTALDCIKRLRSNPDWPIIVENYGGVPYSFHFYEGMWIRNWLRDNGFGETQLQVSNLDDYYIKIVELSLEGL